MRREDIEGKGLGVRSLLGAGFEEKKNTFFESERFSFCELKPGKGVLVVPGIHSPVVHSVFSLSEESRVEVKCGSGRLSVGGGAHTIVVLNDVGCLKMNAAGFSDRSFYLSFSPEFFSRFMEGDFSGFNQGENAGKHMRVLVKEGMRVTPEMRSVIEELITCKRTGVLKKMFLEAKVLKLLMLQLEQYELLSRKEDLKYVREYDVDKIHLAKTILDNSISASISVIELAHRVGLNDFKLKRGFKEIFKTTVYNYLYELRMQEAKRLLLNTDQSVNEIAAYCSYEFVQSFIKAFKRKYGIPPEKFRHSG